MAVAVAVLVDQKSSHPIAWEPPVLDQLAAGRYIHAPGGVPDKVM